jgi:hypothetical protein
LAKYGPDIKAKVDPRAWFHDIVRFAVWSTISIDIPYIGMLFSSADVPAADACPVK